MNEAAYSSLRPPEVTPLPLRKRINYKFRSLLLCSAVRLNTITIIKANVNTVLNTL